MKAKAVQLDWTDGNQIDLLNNGTEFFPSLCEAVDAARHSVHLETYIFTLDRTGRRVLACLCAAARRGVKVRVVIDGFGSAEHAHTIVEQIRHAGGLCKIYRPEPHWTVRWVPSRQRLRRLHRKIAVVDGSCAWIGGINILDDFDDLDPGDGIAVPRYDYAVAVRGPVVPFAIHTQHLLWLRLNWREWRRRGGGLARWRIRRPVTPDRDKALPGTLRAALVLRDNLRYRKTFARVYLHALERAERTVVIANAYFLPGKSFRQALIAAARRGVRIRVLLQGKIEYRMQYHATRALYAPLLAEGIEVYEYMPSYLHAKVAIIDDLATVGSSNIDPFSFLLAREANVLVDDAGFAAQLRQSVEAAIEQGGRQILPDAYHRRGWLRRMADGLAYGLVRIGVSLSGSRGDY